MYSPLAHALHHLNLYGTSYLTQNIETLKDNKRWFIYYIAFANCIHYEIILAFLIS